MATKMGALALMLPLLLLLTATTTRGSARPASFQAALVRTEPGINYTRAVQLSRYRLSMLAARAVSNAGGRAAQSPLRRGAGDYVMEFGIGTPATELWAEADTGSDLIWTKCGACTRCSPQGSPSYYPTSSSSSAFVACGDRPTCGKLTGYKCSRGNNCSYHYAYGVDAGDSHHYTEGILMTETFTFGDGAASSSSFLGVAFGCTLRSEGGFGRGSGLVGLGRGKLSLVTQLNVEAFAYRLSSDLSASSPISFGSLADVTGGNGAADTLLSTPLLTNPAQRDLPFYYVGLTGISVGGKLVQIPPGTFSINRSSGAGGVFFDSGTTLTLLPDPAYTLVRDELLSQMGFRERPPSSSAICFTEGSTTTFPSMVLHFDGGADMNLSTENYLPQMEGQNGERERCWSVVKSPEPLTIIGNIMQMDRRMTCHPATRGCCSNRPPSDTGDV